MKVSKMKQLRAWILCVVTLASVCVGLPDVMSNGNVKAEVPGVNASVKAGEAVVDGKISEGEYGEPLIQNASNSKTWANKAALTNDAEFRFAWSAKGLYVCVKTLDYVTDSSYEGVVWWKHQLYFNPKGALASGTDAHVLEILTSGKVKCNNYDTAFAAKGKETSVTCKTIKNSKTNERITEWLIPTSAFRITGKTESFNFGSGQMSFSALTYVYNGSNTLIQNGATVTTLGNWKIGSIGLGMLTFDAPDISMTAKASDAKIDGVISKDEYASTMTLTGGNTFNWEKDVMQTNVEYNFAWSDKGLYVGIVSDDTVDEMSRYQLYCNPGNQIEKGSNTLAITLFPATGEVKVENHDTAFGKAGTVIKKNIQSVAKRENGIRVAEFLIPISAFRISDADFKFEENTTMACSPAALLYRGGALKETGLAASSMGWTVGTMGMGTMTFAEKEPEPTGAPGYTANAVDAYVDGIISEGEYTSEFVLNGENSLKWQYDAMSTSVKYQFAWSTKGLYVALTTDNSVEKGSIFQIYCNPGGQVASGGKPICISMNPATSSIRVQNQTTSLGTGWVSEGISFATKTTNGIKVSEFLIPISAFRVTDKNFAFVGNTTMDCSVAAILYKDGKAAQTGAAVEAFGNWTVGSMKLGTMKFNPVDPNAKPIVKPTEPENQTTTEKKADYTANAVDVYVDGIISEGEYTDTFTLNGQNGVSWGDYKKLSQNVQYRFAWSSKGLYVAISVPESVDKASLYQIHCNPGGQIPKGKKTLCITMVPATGKIRIQNHKTALAVDGNSYVTGKIQSATNTSKGIRTSEFLIPMDAFRINNTSYTFKAGTLDLSVCAILYKDGKAVENGGAVSTFGGWTIGTMGLGTMKLNPVDPNAKPIKKPVIPTPPADYHAKPVDACVDGVISKGEYGEAFVLSKDNSIPWSNYAKLSTQISFRFAYSEKGLYVAVSVPATDERNSVYQIHCNPGGELADSEKTLCISLYPGKQNLRIQNHSTGVIVDSNGYVSDDIEFATKEKDGVRTMECLIPMDAFRIGKSTYTFAPGTMRLAVFAINYKGGKAAENGAAVTALGNWSVGQMGMGTMELQAVDPNAEPFERPAQKEKVIAAISDKMQKLTLAESKSSPVAIILGAAVLLLGVAGVIVVLRCRKNSKKIKKETK